MRSMTRTGTPIWHANSSPLRFWSVAFFFRSPRVWYHSFSRGAPPRRATAASRTSRTLSFERGASWSAGSRPPSAASSVPEPVLRRRWSLPPPRGGKPLSHITTSSEAAVWAAGPAAPFSVAPEARARPCLASMNPEARVTERNTSSSVHWLMPHSRTAPSLLSRNVSALDTIASAAYGIW